MDRVSRGGSVSVAFVMRGSPRCRETVTFNGSLATRAYAVIHAARVSWAHWRLPDLPKVVLC